MNSLGALEREVLGVVRDQGESSVTAVSSRLNDVYAYTTVMTTLDRLYKKGLLSRRKDGRAYLYSSIYSMEEIEHGVAQDVISKLLETSTGQARPVLSCIVDSVSERDRMLLDELEQLVRKKREQLEAGEGK